MWLPSVIYNTTVCGTFDYIPYAVPSIPVTHSFRNWGPVPPTPLHPFCPSSHPWQPPRLFSILMDLFLLSVCLFIHLFCLFAFFRFYLYVKPYGVCFCFCFLSSCLVLQISFVRIYQKRPRSGKKNQNHGCISGCRP